MVKSIAPYSRTWQNRGNLYLLQNVCERMICLVSHHHFSTTTNLCRSVINFATMYFLGSVTTVTEWGKVLLIINIKTAWKDWLVIVKVFLYHHPHWDSIGIIKMPSQKREIKYIKNLSNLMLNVPSPSLPKKSGKLIIDLIRLIPVKSSQHSL